MRPAHCRPITSSRGVERRTPTVTESRHPRREGPVFREGRMTLGDDRNVEVEGMALCVVARHTLCSPRWACCPTVDQSGRTRLAHRNRTTSGGRQPVADFVAGLPAKTQAAILTALERIEKRGLDAPGIGFRKIRGRVWEIRIRSATPERRMEEILR